MLSFGMAAATRVETNAFSWMRFVQCLIWNALILHVEWPQQPESPLVPLALSIRLAAWVAVRLTHVIVSGNAEVCKNRFGVDIFVAAFPFFCLFLHADVCVSL